MRPVRDFVSSISSLGSKDQQIADLQKENDELKAQADKEQYTRNRAQELDDLLKLSEGKSVLLEEYAREMIVQEEMHLDEVNKMLRRPGAMEPFQE